MKVVSQSTSKMESGYVKSTLACWEVGVTYKRGSNWLIVFTDTLFTQLGTTGSYSTITDLNNLQFTVTRALGF
jgi:hypothetical protein